MNAISVRNLNKTFGKKLALDNISLDIAKGEMVALIGASGSGKSTLMRHICGLETAQAGLGRIEIMGRSIQSGGRLARDARGLRRNIGVVFQQFNLVARLSTLSNVLLGNLGRIPVWRGTLGLFSAEEKRLAREALARVGIPEVGWQRASTLSGGQQQRAAIARTLVQRSEILLADEPTAALDSENGQAVMALLAEIAKDKSHAVLAVTHDHRTLPYADRIIHIEDGLIVGDERPERDRGAIVSPPPTIPLDAMRPAGGPVATSPAADGAHQRPSKKRKNKSHG